VALKLSDAQLKQIAAKLFLLQPAKDTRLPKPVNSTGAAALDAKLAAVASDSRFKEMGIGVVDFTGGLFAPRVWLHNGDAAWRAGSTNKIAILLAAAQLRDDVRKVQETKLLAKPEEYDELFASPRLWELAADPATRVMTRQIAGTAHAPRISTIFDFTNVGTLNFAGPDPDKPDAKAIVDAIVAVTGAPRDKAHLTWPLTTDYDFAERLWLTGGLSDNVAATSCMSQIGVPYLKAVQFAYGLFEPAKGLHMLLAGPYSAEGGTKVPVNNNTKETFRRLTRIQTNRVKDGLYQSSTGRFDNHLSWQPASAASLTAFMVALAQDQFVAFGNGLGAGIAGCTTIRANLSAGKADMTQSFIANGAAKAATVDVERTKIGLLGRADGEPGPLNCEFAYLETTTATAPPKKLKYGVVATGIKSIYNPNGTVKQSAASLTTDLGQLVQEGLAK
jgi:hypothetical protein